MRSFAGWGSVLSGVLTFSFSACLLQAGSALDVAGIGNFHQVNEHIYRGAQPHGQGFSSLAQLGIKTVIDLRGESSERTAVERAGLHYVLMPWNGFKAPDEAQVAAVLGLLNDSNQWPVFVHCRRGADRTGTAIACYRIAHDHWSNQQALSEARTFGMSSLEMAMQRYILHFGPPATASAAVVAPPASPIP
jgi:tyrosine-protein phosphatase SIW14